MAEFDDAIDDVEFQSSSPTSKPEGKQLKILLTL